MIVSLILSAVSFSIDEIGAAAAKLNTAAKRCSREVLAGFDPTIHLSTLNPSSGVYKVASFPHEGR